MCFFFPLKGDDTTPIQQCCDVLCGEITNYANEKKSSQLKEIYIVSKEEGTHFVCTEALRRRFATSAKDNRPGSKDKNAEPVRSKAKSCAVCHN